MSLDLWVRSDRSIENRILKELREKKTISADDIHDDDLDDYIADRRRSWNVIGAAFHALASRGKIEKVKLTYSKREKRHGAMIWVWRLKR
uniref:Uncharacterized protein n=1 Tax=viral metagenome TaxID=1070528 RepID=A0A6M3JIG9_9ZZZZ